MALYKGENPYIYGLHDKGGERLMLVNGEAKGWVLISEAIGTEANETGGHDYRDVSSSGLGLIVRLNQSYGPNGTIPREARYPEFAQRCANFAQNSPGASIWLIGNEMNMANEQPRQEGSSQPEPITPRRYAKCYSMVRQKIKALPGHQNDLVVIGAPAPWNDQTKYDADPQGKYPANPTGDWVQYLRDILLAIGPGGADAIAIHAYSHGYKADLVFSDAKMNPPFQNRYYNFYVYRDFMNAIPENMRQLPVYLTEMNGDKEPNGDTWPFGNNGWIKNAYQEINRWNQTGQQQIRCAILFRWMIDPLGWSIDGKAEVQKDFSEAIVKNYKWIQDITPPQPAIPRPDVPGYRTRYLNHNTPTSVEAGKDAIVTLILQNAGSFTWLAAGDKPFRLGFQWYNAAGQFVQMPTQFDYRTPLAANVPPGGQVTLQARVHFPDTPGTYQLRWDMVHEMVTWFATQGDAGLLVSPVAVTAPVVTPTPKPPVTTPTPPITTPEPPVTEAGHVQIQNLVGQLLVHDSKRYVNRPLDAIKRVIIHHAGTPPSVTVQRIAEYQVKTKDLPGITWHYCTTADGQVYQTQPLTVTAAHAGQNSLDSVGICLVGNFTDAPPPEAQLNATASVLAQVLASLKLGLDQVVGYSEIAVTGSPGATWPQWKPALLAKTRALMQAVAPAPTMPEQPVDRKPISHYMLFWYKGPGNWAEWDLRGATEYIDRFSPTIGFSIEEAQFAKYVTIVGGPGGVPSTAEQTLRNAGCKVERIAGANEAETRKMLESMAANGQRFKNPQ
ncbi:MAG: hypothetical protein FOGNACKC_05898 [Anaerolineae bacterium]|nr:hypothetical protein [Anaerolineae bacterium]